MGNKLAINYSKEIISELDMIPVYLPGTKVEPGDIISFKHRNFFGRTQPVGQFRKEGNVGLLGIDVSLEKDDDLGSLKFTSKEGVNTEFNLGADAADLANGELKVSFNKEGSTFLAASGIRESRISNLDPLRSGLNQKRNRYTGDWNQSFIVITVRIAAKALIMQSSSSQGSLSIKGNAQVLQPDSPVDIDANLNFQISGYKDAAFIKDWADDVELFLGLARYRQKFTGGWELGHGFAKNSSSDWEMTSVHPDEVDINPDV